jgi:hypothetical protein
MTAPIPPNTPPPTLPDYRPKGMSKSDRLLAWSMGFIIVIFGLVTINHYVTISTPAHAPVVSVKHDPKPAATVAPNHEVIVFNKDSGYIWFLDATGSQFTPKTAAKFIVGHPEYRVFTLKLK